MVRVVAIGECMIELYQAVAGSMVCGFGGDTLNAAVYLARLVAAHGVSVDYATALGDDPFSDEMLARWQAEGIGTALVIRLPGRLPGLYAIRTDGRGERSFYYWREAAAARDMLRGSAGENLMRRLVEYDVIYLSGITLSLLDQTSRDKLLGMLETARRLGSRVVADSNYRPRGWSGQDEARAWITELYRRTDIALPSLEDQSTLFGDHDSAAAADRLHELGVVEIAIKAAGAPCLVSWPGGRTTVPPVPVAAPVDTTAAGDAFNAGYLAARLFECDPEAAVRSGHALAAIVVRHRGAIVPAAAMAHLAPA